jgi:hypothetical protein
MNEKSNYRLLIILLIFIVIVESVLIIWHLLVTGIPVLFATLLSIAVAIYVVFLLRTKMHPSLKLTVLIGVIAILTFYMLNYSIALNQRSMDDIPKRYYKIK